MKGITKRNDGRYMIRKTINGKKYLQYAKTKEQAKQLLQKIKKGKIQENVKKKFKFEEWIDKWIELYKKPFLRDKSLSDMKCYVNIIKKDFGKKEMSSIRPDEIQIYLNKMHVSRRKDRITQYFNAILQKAVDLGILNRNPFHAVIKDKKSNNRNTAFTFIEQTKILEKIKDTDIEHEIYIYLLCGCRPNELPNKENFDFKNKIINIFGTKNKNSKHRQVEMTQKFANYIESYLQNNEIKQVKYISKKFKEICTELNIDKSLLYRLRHTFATNQFALGTNTKYIQSWLGHGSISVTMDIYTDIDKTLTKDKIKKLYNNFYFVI